MLAFNIAICMWTIWRDMTVVYLQLMESIVQQAVRKFVPITTYHYSGNNKITTPRLYKSVPNCIYILARNR